MSENGEIYTDGINFKLVRLSLNSSEFLWGICQGWDVFAIKQK